MENETERQPIIEIFKSVVQFGSKALDEFDKAPLRRRFLWRTAKGLRLLYGEQSPVVRKFIEAQKNFKSISISELRSLVSEIEHLQYLLDYNAWELRAEQSQPSRYPPGKKVFIIHGHDEINMLRLKFMLQDHFNLEPVLMARSAGMSRALLDKFEDSASKCTLAFALMTPDDVISNPHYHDSYSQARPNVIFEAGWFVGRLGASRLCLLLKEGATVQSDIDGISRIPFREDIREKAMEIQRELEAANLL
jgi:predicted nucleotide-binding protein